MGNISIGCEIELIDVAHVLNSAEGAVSQAVEEVPRGENTSNGLEVPANPTVDDIVQVAKLRDVGFTDLNFFLERLVAVFEGLAAVFAD